MMLTVQHNLAAEALVFTSQGRDFVLTDLPDSHDLKRISGVIDENDYPEEPFFLFFVEDCMDPSVFLVRAVDFETAYADFLDAKAEDLGLVISVEMLAEDYNGEAPSFTDTGLPIETDSVQGFPVSFSHTLKVSEAGADR